MLEMIFGGNYLNATFMLEMSFDEDYLNETFMLEMIFWRRLFK